MLTQKVEFEVRYCEDCQFFKQERHSERCSHPLVQTENLVRRDGGHAFCTVARKEFEHLTTCGPHGRYWQRREIVRVPLKPRWSLVGWLTR